MLARSNGRRAGALDRLSQLSQTQEDVHTPHDSAAESEVLQLMATLTPLQQKICQGLMNGLSTLEIATLTGRHYTTICRHIQHIRRAFTDRGFDKWFA